MNQKAGRSRHLGRLLTGSILIAGALLTAVLYLLATPSATGHAPSTPRPITSWSPVTTYSGPQRPFVLHVTPKPALLPTARPRPNPKVEVPKPVVAPKRTPDGGPADAALVHQLRGRTSWYCRAGVSICHYQYPDTGGFDAYAAAGPALRQAIGPGWRGTVVTVNGVRVRLVDWCQCSKGLAREKVIDLYWDVAHALDISGVGRVTIRW